MVITLTFSTLFSVMFLVLGSVVVGAQRLCYPKGLEVHSNSP